jgi:hypothetical protein
MLQFNDVLFYLILITAWVIFRTSRAIYYRKLSIAREGVVNLFFFYLCYVISLTFSPSLTSSIPTAAPPTSFPW